MAQLRVNGSRLGRDCRGEACLARRVRRTRIAIIRGIVVIGGASHTHYRCCDYSFQNIIVCYRGRGIISITRIYSAGEACLAPTKPFLRKATNAILLPLQKRCY